MSVDTEARHHLEKHEAECKLRHQMIDKNFSLINKRLQRLEIIILSLLVILIAGCAAKPSAIQPAMVSTAEYVNMSCQNLDTRIIKIINRLNITI